MNCRVLAFIIFVIAASLPMCAQEIDSGASAGRTVNDYPAFRGLFPFGMYVAAERMADAWDKPDPSHIGRPALELYKRDLADMALHYINVIAIENTSGIPVPTLRKMIREGHNAGILTWASENGLPNDEELEKWSNSRHSLFKNEAGLLAWSPFDEPYPEQMDRWLKAKRIIEKSDPNHPVIAVTCGGPKGFEKYSIVQAYDYYPVYLENPNPWDIGPMVTRYVNECYGKPIWFVQQAFQGEGRRLPTIAESRMMTYTALACGAKGIFYFIYDHITDPANNTTPLYEDIGLMGRRLRAIGPQLLDTSPDPNNKMVELTASSNKDRFRPQDMPSAIMPVLKSPAGHYFIIVYNTSVEEPVSVSLRLGSSAGSKQIYDLFMIVDRNQDPVGSREMTLKLSPGDGAVLLLSDLSTFTRVSRAVRRSLLDTEMNRLKVEMGPVKAWKLPLDQVNELISEIRKTAGIGNYKRALDLQESTRVKLAEIKGSDPLYKNTRTALDLARQRIPDYRTISRKAASRDPSQDEQLNWKYWGLISRYLELENRFSNGDRSIIKETEALRNEIESAIGSARKTAIGG